jgi:hypothetical protein
MREVWDRLKLIWVNPGSVNYSQPHIRWLLPLLVELRAGYYPANPRETGYTGGNGRRSVTHAYYEKADEIAGEIDRRLAMCGMDRYIVEDMYCRDYPELEGRDLEDKAYDIAAELARDDRLREIARKINMDEYEVRRRLYSAVSYISSGPCPRFQPCDYCVKVNCKKRGRKPLSYQKWCRVRWRQAQKTAFAVSSLTNHS